MDTLIKSISNNILVLKEYFNIEKGDHYPREIIHLIIDLYYKLNNVQLSCYSICNQFLSQVIIGGKIHSSEKVDTMFYVADVVKLISNDRSTFYLTKFGEVYYYENNTACSRLELSDIVDIACGYGHAVFLSSTGEVYTWITFAKNVGQCGVVYSKYIGWCTIKKVDLKNIVKICAGGNSSMALSHTGEVYVWGENNYGKLGLGHKENQYLPQKINFWDGKEKVTKISCGYDHTIFLTEKNNVYGCGNDAFYRCEVGGHKNQLLPQRINISDIVDIGCGRYSTIALTKDNKIHYWELWKTTSMVNLENVIQFGIGGSCVVAMTASLEIYLLGGKNGEINSKIKFNYNKNKLC